jgi:hypothetical protein
MTTLLDDVEAPLLDDEGVPLDEDVVELSEEDSDFVHQLVTKILIFVDELAGHALHPYQREFAYRCIESVVINDGEELTALFSRQSGKTETIANVVAALMILLPKLARIFPIWLGKFVDGFWVGTFAPVESQAETLYGRIVNRLTSDRALEMLADPEIDDAVQGGGKLIKLKKSGSFARMQTANPKASIESKSYHLIVIDEAQKADERTVRKSIHPMGAYYNATIVKTGTPDIHKGDFYKAIRHNQRRQTRRGARQCHFQNDWKICAKYNANYEKFVRKEMARIGADSDEFQMSYCLKWLLDRGMFTTEERIDELSDKSMEIVKSYHGTPIVFGLDVARKLDSTVLTAIWVDWSRPDEFGYYDHRVLNWLEIHGDQWEEQYGKIVDFCRAYSGVKLGIDAQGIGDVVADRLARLMPELEVVAMGSSSSEQSARWKHLSELIGRGMVSWPGHAKTRRLRTWRRFEGQMKDLEKKYQGKFLLAAAPEEAEAHDDYPDSLAIGCYLTKDWTMAEVEQTHSPFYQRSAR